MFPARSHEEPPLNVTPSKTYTVEHEYSTRLFVQPVPVIDSGTTGIHSAAGAAQFRLAGRKLRKAERAPLKD